MFRLTPGTHTDKRLLQRVATWLLQPAELGAASSWFFR